MPSNLLRKIGQKEITGIGKVKVILKVCANMSFAVPEDSPEQRVLSMDKKKKQIALYEPVQPNGATEERKHTASAAKLFAFDALFSEEDAQVDICVNALSDVIHAVINGDDGCIFCFGNAKIGKTRTMIGSCESSSTLGVIPCAIAWLYGAVNEQKQKTGTRFSVRVSAVEITATSPQQMKDLLADYASDNEQSPGVYLEDDPILGTHLQNRNELRAPLPEKAAFYLDAAQNERTSGEESHFLYTLHVYRYNVATKGTVAGGRSRLYLIDLAGHDRTKNNSGSLSVSNLGNVLLAIFNGQKHLPHRDNKISRVLKECLSLLTCHVTIIAHVSPAARHYHETLATAQFASRIHRIRRRKIKFMGVSNGVNTTTDENGRLTSSSDLDPSSSEQSADTVIYVGPSDETDGEHPPVCIPNLNSADARAAFSKVLRESVSVSVSVSESDCLVRGCSSMPASPRKLPGSAVVVAAKAGDKVKQSIPAADVAAAATITTPVMARKHHRCELLTGFHSAHSSPVKTVTRAAAATESSMLLMEERWIDGPRISKSKVAEARNVHAATRKEGDQKSTTGKREMWVDGPMKDDDVDDHDHERKEPVYGFMDGHKKNMIREWVENQSLQLQDRLKKKDHHQSEAKTRPQYKPLTVFKTCGDDDAAEQTPRRDKHHHHLHHHHHHSDKSLKSNSTECGTSSSSSIPNKRYEDNRATAINHVSSDKEAEGSEDDIEIEIVEIEEPEEPVPTQDSCLQVTEEDIALCMEELENPLPEVDQKQHPLRVLSEENLTVVSTFADSISVMDELDRLYPQNRWHLRCNLMSQPGRIISAVSAGVNHDDEVRSALTRLGDRVRVRVCRNECDAGRGSGSGGAVFTKYANGDVDAGVDAGRAVSRCQSLMLSEMCDSSLQPNNSRTLVDYDFENNSIVSEPAYVTNSIEGGGGGGGGGGVGGTEKLCEKCKGSLNSIEYAPQNGEYFWYRNKLLSEKLRSYSHMKNIMNLRHPDGASNPNLQETDENKRYEKARSGENSSSVSDECDDHVPLPLLTTELLTLERKKFGNGNFSKRYDNLDRLNVTSQDELCNNGFRKMEQIVRPKNRYSRANVKKLRTYRIELQKK